MRDVCLGSITVSMFWIAIFLLLIWNESLEISYILREAMLR